MPLEVQPPESDLLIPLPEDGESWDPHTVHTHFVGACVPEEAISILTYIRYQPAFGLCSGGVDIYRGLDNAVLPEVAHFDYEYTMPWPEISGNRITTANGLSMDFVEPGKRINVTYAAPDGSAELELTAEGITPLVARGHITPDEGDHVELEPGGSEQFMHMTGSVRLGDESFEVDANYARDRSWRQVRREGRDVVVYPPITWTPVYFGDHLAFNQISFEDPASDPPWAGSFEIPDGAPTHNWGWLYRDGELRDLASVRRRVSKHHPVYMAPLEMEIELTDERGDDYLVRGEAIGFAPILGGWPNLTAFESLMHWTDETGAETHGPAQSFWGAKAAHALRPHREFALAKPV